jgi:arginase
MGAGPEHLLSNGLGDRLRANGHEVTSVVVDHGDGPPAEIATAFALMARVAGEVRAARSNGAFPLVLSGNCNSACGTLAGLTPDERAVFWFDAHGDANTPETTTTGFLDGTGLAAAMGWCWNGMTRRIPGFAPVDERGVVLLGARDLDPDEAALLDRASVRRISCRDITDTFDRTLPKMPPKAVAYLHCDLDVLDPIEGQANPFPTPGGLTVASLEQAIARIGATVPIAAAAVTAYAPEYDGDGRICRAAFRVVDAIVAAVRPISREP